MVERDKYENSHFSLFEVKDLNESISDNKLRDSVYFNRIPSKLKKTFCFSIFLVIIGIGLLIAGIVKGIIFSDIRESFPFIILSIICLIPGVYYSIQFIRAKIEIDPDYRREILDEIPSI
jgi:hypothetical protein